MNGTSAWALTVSLLLLGGCAKSLSEHEPFPCAQDGTCPGSYVCRASVCVACSDPTPCAGKCGAFVDKCDRPVVCSSDCGDAGNTCGGGGEANVCGCGVGNRCPPDVLATGQNGLGCIALDDRNVYWTNYGGQTVMKLPKDGGELVALAAAQPGPLTLAVGPDRVYWNNFGNGSIRSVSIEGGPETPIADGLVVGGPVTVGVDSTQLYWAANLLEYAIAELDGGLIVQRNLNVGAYSYQLVVGADRVFVAAGGYGVLSLPKDGGTDGGADDALFAKSLNLDQGIAVNSTHLFVAGPGGIERISIDGGGFEPLHYVENGNTVAVGEGSIGLVADDEAIYWAGGKGVFSWRFDGGAPAQISKQPSQTQHYMPQILAMDRDHVYWLSGEQVLKARK